MLNSDYLILSDMACMALTDELVLYPKAGLVSQYDNGSHQDMDYGLFIKSIQAIKRYFDDLITIAQQAHTFSDLKALGIQAEMRMLQATNNINTHRGAIFILGILVPSIIEALKTKQSIMSAQQVIITKYAHDIKNHQTNPLSHGSIIRKQFNLTTIVELAANGFPIVFNALAYLNQQLIKYNQEQAYLMTFYYIMHHLDDTNIIHRGGLDGLQFTKTHAGEIIQLTNYQDIYAYALYLHQRFVAKNLSAGGCADILSAVLLLHKVQQKWA